MLKHIFAAFRLKRAGVFDSESYIASNLDLSRVRFPTLHFVKHGVREERRYRGSHFEYWSAEQVIESNISPKLARCLSRIEEVEGIQTVLKKMEEVGVRSSALRMACAIEAGDSKVISKIMAQSTGQEFFDFAFELALKRMNQTYAPQAMSWGVAQLNKESVVSLNFLDRLRSFSEVLPFGDLGKVAFHRALLRKWLRNRPSNFEIRPDDLQLLGFPLAVEDRNTFDHASSVLREVGAGKFSSDVYERRGLGAERARLVNTATLNSLCERGFAIDPLSEWNVGELGSDERFASVRLPRAHFWFRPRQSKFNDGIVDATEMLASSAARTTGLRLYPTHAGRLHHLDKPEPRSDLTVSYHSINTTVGKFVHFKETSLPGWYTIDGRGYSGWSSKILRKKLSDASRCGVSEVDEIRSQFRQSRSTKYAQSENEKNFPEGGVFFPLQIAGDSVMGLSELISAEVARKLCEVTKELRTPLIIKTHPLDLSKETQLWLTSLANEYDNLYLVDAHIHDLITQSLCVVVANSGVGLEAVLLGAPVITFAPSEYESATLTVRSLEQLEETVIELINSGPSEEASQAVDDFLSLFFSTGAFRLTESAAEIDKKIKQTVQHQS